MAMTAANAILGANDKDEDEIARPDELRSTSGRDDKEAVG